METKTQADTKNHVHIAAHTDAHGETHIGTKKQSLYEKVISAALAVCIIVLPVFIIPNSNIGFFFAKFGLVTCAVLFSVIVLVLQVLSERSIERYSIFLNTVLFATPLVYIVSSFFSANVGASLMGNGAELDTAYFIFLGSILMYLVSRSFRTKKSLLSLTLSFLVVASIVFIFHILRFVFGADFLSFGIFSSISSNTVGSFNELGMYAGLTAIVALLGLELLTPEKRFKYGLYVSLVASLIVVTVSNFTLLNSFLGFGFAFSLSFFVGLFALIVFIHKKVAEPKAGLPLASLITLLVSLVLTIASGPISDYVGPKVGITPQQVLDVRVSPIATKDLAWNTYSEGVVPALLGTGPNKFYTAWAKYKPTSGNTSVNTTDFWSVDFNLASGFVPTAFVTTGILGGLSWILLFLVLLYYISKLLKLIIQSEKDQMAVYSAWVVSVGTVYLWLMAVLFTAGPVLLFTAFIFTGLLIGTFVREGIVKVKIVSWDVAKYWRGFILTFAMILIIIASMYLGYVWQQRLSASMQVQDAAQVLQKDNTAISSVQLKLLKAINTYFDTATLRLASEISLIRPTALVAQAGGVVSPDKLTKDIVSDINFSISAARRAAIDLGSSADYKDWLQLGKAYETATFLGATSTASLAVQSYLEAEKLNPTSPVPPFLIGRLYALARGFDIATQKVEQAIALKPNYTEATALLKSIHDAEAKGQYIPPADLAPTPAISGTEATSSPKINSKAKVPAKR